MAGLENVAEKKKVLVIMGTTATGKSKLSISLASYFDGEIINSDKMQVYKGLDVLTNKVTEEESCGIPHHLISVIDPDEDFTIQDFRQAVMALLESIVSRCRLPIIVGGSNSYIEALIDDESGEFRSQYDCCFLWVDVDLSVLDHIASIRVDKMVEAGLIDEVRGIFHPEADYTRGIRRSIGVPEMHEYLQEVASCDEIKPSKLLEKGIEAIKTNTRNLIRNQLRKIHRLHTLPGWNLNRLDSTLVFQKHGTEMEQTWKDLIFIPSTKIVSEFLAHKGSVAENKGQPWMSTSETHLPSAIPC